MTFQVPITIEKALDRIQSQEYVLPAIQREFEWSTDQVIRLFDSLMRGYPIGSFLLWNVRPRDGTLADEARDFAFYGFIREYHELKSPHCPRLDVAHNRAVTAVLDGQQRLTALNIGLRGSHAEKLPRRWRNNVDAYPVKRLYLNITALAAENELGMEYDFQFLTDEAAKAGGTQWFLVGDILKYEDATPIFEFVQKAGLAESKVAFKALNRLHAMVRTEGTISYYEEEAQDLDKVLNIFIRVNSGGTVLSYSDLLLSIATAQWSERDAREAIHSLVDEVNAPPQSFGFSKDLVLKAGLVLTDVGDIRFKVTNFNRTNMSTLEKRWDSVSFSIRLAARLLSEFGFSDENLPADSPLVPIAYYLHQRHADDAYLTSMKDKDDREVIRRWVIRSLIKSGVWGSGLDTLLAALRRVIRDATAAGFPIVAIEKEMAGLGKSLVFQQEEIDELLETPYGNRRVYPLLGLLYPGVNVRALFHEDHVFPKSRFTRKRLLGAGVAEAEVNGYMDKVNRLPNLQLLEGPVNIAKLAALPAAWAKSFYPTQVERDAYLAFHDLDGLPEDLTDFGGFFDRRRQLMESRLRALLVAPEA
jgi:hypothetical protein